MDTWTLDKLALLRKHYASWSDDGLAAMLQVSTASITAKATELALAKNKAAFVGTRKTPRWSDAEIESLRAMYGNHPNVEIAKSLGRSIKSVASKASQFKLTKSPELLVRMGRRNRALRRPQGNASQ